MLSRGKSHANVFLLITVYPSKVVSAISTKRSFQDLRSTSRQLTSLRKEKCSLRTKHFGFLFSHKICFLEIPRFVCYSQNSSSRFCTECGHLSDDFKTRLLNLLLGNLAVEDWFCCCHRLVSLLKYVILLLCLLCEYSIYPFIVIIIGLMHLLLELAWVREVLPSSLSTL